MLDCVLCETPCVRVCHVCVRFVRTARTRVSAQDTGWIHCPGSLRANMSRLLRRVIQREGYASSANQTTQRRKAVVGATAALDRWQAAETSRRRALEASKKSAEALQKTQRASDEVLDNLLKIVQDFDMQVHHHHARRQLGVGSGWVVSRLPPGDGKGRCRDR